MLGLSFDIEKMIITFHFIAYLLQTESGIEESLSQFS